MPITGPASYLPTTDLFIAHWTACNTALGSSGNIVLAGGATVASLTAYRTNLATQRAEVEAERNGREYARAMIEISKEALHGRLMQFNAKLASLATDDVWTSMRPKAYSLGDGQGKVIPPLDDMADLWVRYEAEESALTLVGGYSLANFTAELATLKAAYVSYGSADNGLSMIRARRNQTQEYIYAILKQYRQAVPATFPEGAPELVTLPRLSPLPGHTPDPVSASGAFNVATTEADLAWTATTDTSADHYEVRGTVGPEFEDDDETLLATIPVGGPLVFSTPFGLGVPGAASSYKVFVVTTEGNERGSNTVTVTRPATP